MNKFETTSGVFLQSEMSPIVFFNSKTMKLFTVDQQDTLDFDSIVRDLRMDTSEDMISQIDKSEQPNTFYLERRQAILPILMGTTSLINAHIRPGIGRLTINISNACNLWCSYCYADHGLYHAPKSFMSPELAKKIVDKVLEMYEGIEIVHFFGGEPLMNLKAINAVGEAFASALENGRISSLPKFVATTNGTISTPSTISTIKRWGIELTVSWDGPKQVHDQMRPTMNNESSYDKIIGTIDIFSKNNISYTIECTYNSSHLIANISVVDLMVFFHEATGQKLFHIAPASLPSSLNQQNSINNQQIFRGDLKLQQNNHLHLDRIIPLYREAARQTVRNLFSGEGPLLDFAHRVVEQVAQQTPIENYCPAFFNQLSIAIDGAVYPCFMFIGDPKFNLGNILEDEFPTIQGSELFRRYFQEFGFSPVGTDKWYAPLFSGCIASDYITSSKMDVNAVAPLFEAIIEESLLSISSNFSERGFFPQVSSSFYC